MRSIGRLIQAKLRAALAGPPPRRQPAEGRLPPGQRLVDRLPVLDLGTRPRIPREQWRLRVQGAVAGPLTLDWAAIQTLPQVDVVADVHCVTRWSRLEVPWRGVRARDVLALARPTPAASHALLGAADGYTTNLPLAALLDDDVLLAHSVDGKPLTTEHGGPLRLVVPRRYFWKSAKWLTRIEVREADAPGFWEERGYHNDADPWREERFRARPPAPAAGALRRAATAPDEVAPGLHGIHNDPRGDHP
jgi:DMSO/TMAO reductase YedYZ molybdopterin-dependent catalytic subunit